MDQDAALPVRLPPSRTRTPSMTATERDELEHHIHCQCGCTLDVFTCRTTDFSCQVSPAMHRDVMALVRRRLQRRRRSSTRSSNVYGERALMAPKTSGFNLIAWLLPGVALIGGGSVLALLLKRWGERSRARAATVKPFIATRGDSRRDAGGAGTSRGRGPWRRHGVIAALVVGTLLAVGALAFVLYPVFFGVSRQPSALVTAALERRRVGDRRAP